MENEKQKKILFALIPIVIAFLFYFVIIQSTGESLLFLAIASMANNCKTGECQKNSRQSDSFIVLKKLGNANGGKGAT